MGADPFCSPALSALSPTSLDPHCSNPLLPRPDKGADALANFDHAVDLLTSVPYSLDAMLAAHALLTTGSATPPSQLRGDVAVAVGYHYFAPDNQLAANVSEVLGRAQADLEAAADGIPAPLRVAAIAGDLLSIVTRFHPFTDGNGRIGRALAASAARKLGVRQALNLVGSSELLPLYTLANERAAVKDDVDALRTHALVALAQPACAWQAAVAPPADPACGPLSTYLEMAKSPALQRMRRTTTDRDYTVICNEGCDTCYGSCDHDESCDTSCNTGCDEGYWTDCDICSSSCDRCNVYTTSCDGSCDTSCDGTCTQSNCNSNCNTGCDLFTSGCDDSCNTNCNTCFSGCDANCDTCNTGCNGCPVNCDSACDGSCQCNAGYGGSGQNCDYCVDSYKPSAGNGNCLACPACSGNRYRINCRGTSAGSCTSCGSCPAGQERVGCAGTNPGSCRACSSGYYRTSGMASCQRCEQDCPAGQERVGCGGSSAGFCRGVQCETLAAPTHGSVSYSLSNRYPAKASFSCSAGYELVGSSQLSCGTDGNYPNSLPTCRGKLCPTLSLANGNVAYSNGRRYPSTASFSCATGMFAPQLGPSRSTFFPFLLGRPPLPAVFFLPAHLTPPPPPSTSFPDI